LSEVMSMIEPTGLYVADVGILRLHYRNITSMAPTVHVEMGFRHQEAVEGINSRSVSLRAIRTFNRRGRG
jgi:hypothetical protein